MKSGSGCLADRRLRPTALYQTRWERAGREWSGRFLTFQAERWRVWNRTRNYEWRKTIHNLPGPTKVQTFKHSKTQKTQMFVFLGNIFLFCTELREEDVLGSFSHGWLTAAVWAGVDLPTPHLTHSRAPGGRATRARHDKAQGLFAALAGGLTFPGHRSEVKKTLPEGRPLTTLAWQNLVKGLWSQNKYLSFACRDHNQCHFNYPLQQTHTQLLFQANSLRLTIFLFSIFHWINIFFTQ